MVSRSGSKQEAGDHADRPRRRLTIDVGTLAALSGWAALSVTLLLVTVNPWTTGAGIFAGGADLHVYRDGAFRILNGLPLYTEPVLFGLQYTYTPFSTLVFVPIEQIPWGAVNNLWMAVNLGVLFSCILLSWQILGYRTTPLLASVSALVALGSTFLEPVRTTLFYGQINLVLMLLVLLDFSRRDRSLIRGVGVGLAAGIKLTPLYFVALLAVLGQWRSAAVAAATFVLSIVAAWLLLPLDSHVYWTSTFFQSNRISDDTHPSNQSLRGTIAHLTGSPAPTWLWLGMGAAIAVTSLLVSGQLYKNGEKLLAVTLSGLTASVVSPFSWSHHWVWFVPLLVYLIDRSLHRSRWWIAILCICLAAGAWPYMWAADNIVIGLFLLPPWWPVTKLLVNVYLVIYLGVMVGSIVRVRNTKNENATETKDSDNIRSQICDTPYRNVTDARVNNEIGSVPRREQEEAL